MQTTLHLIWVGGKLKDDYIASTRSLLVAARKHKVYVNFFVDNQSIGSIRNLLWGSLQDRYMKMQNLDPSYNFFSSHHVKVINIDKDLKTYLHDFVRNPHIKNVLEPLFPNYQPDEVADFILCMIDLDRCGQFKNLAAVSDVLRAIAIIKGESGASYYADVDIQLKRDEVFDTQGLFEQPTKFMINLKPPEFKGFNNDILAAPAYDHFYIEFFTHIISKYLFYFYGDTDFYRILLQKHQVEKNAQHSEILDKMLIAEREQWYTLMQEHPFSAMKAKRITDRFLVTHKTTGNISLYQLLKKYHSITSEHSLNKPGNIFFQSDSRSFISWLKDVEYRASDDRDIKYFLDVSTCLKNSELIKNRIDPIKLIKCYIEYLLFQNSTAIKQLASKLGGSELLKNSIDDCLQDCWNEFPRKLNSFHIAITNRKTDLFYFTFLRSCELLCGLYSLETVHGIEENYVSDKSRILAYSMLSTLNDYRRCLNSTKYFDAEIWHSLSKLYILYHKQLNRSLRHRAAINKLFEFKDRLQISDRFFDKFLRIKASLSDQPLDKISDINYFLKCLVYCDKSEERAENFKLFLKEKFPSLEVSPGLDVDNLLYYICFFERKKYLNSLLSVGYHFKESDANNVILTIICNHKDVTILKTLHDDFQFPIDFRSMTLGAAPYHVAAMSGNLPAYQYYRNRGAPLYARTHTGLDVLELAVIHKQEKFIDYLLHEENFDFESNDSITFYKKLINQHWPEFMESFHKTLARIKNDRN